MQSMHNIFSHRRAVLIGCTALATVFGSAHAFAADAPPAATPPAATAADGTTVAEIVVTAQKRTQNQQDVPISLTAVPAAALEANRITSVVDLGTTVPNLASRPTGGGAQSPSFTMRGITSYGVVAGSDKELSIYIDGVYIASSVGSGLDLPEVAQIEVLRGPQGTLFGRNATVGAIAVVTRDPPANFGLNQEFTVGNYRQFRSKTRIDLGSWGPFSATASFVHDQRRGDMENLGAGTTFTTPAGSGLPATLVSPKYLGDKNLNSFFGAIKFEPDSHLKIVNKFDWTGNHYTPQGSSVVGVEPSGLGPYGGAFLTTLIDSQPTPVDFNTTGKRPDQTNNSFTTPGYARDWGDNLTAEYKVDSSLSFKNVLAYRSSYVRAGSQLDGLGGLILTPQSIPAYAGFAASSAVPGFFGFPAATQQAIIAQYQAGLAPLVGSPFEVFAIEQVTKSYQWSDEFQANYNSQLLTLTAGALYFIVKGESGGALGTPNDVIIAPLPGGSVAGESSRAYYVNKSLAGYVQAEVHATSQVDLVGGVRVTNDKKNGSYVTDTTLFYTPYNSTRLSETLGVNYKPTRDILVYGKYSSAFVAGGFSGPISYLPEKAYSWEAGIKSDWFGHRFRANFAVYDVKYVDIQTAQAGSTLGFPLIGLAVADLGDERAKGFELETTTVPVRGLTLGAAAGYTTEKYLRLNPIISLLGSPATLGTFRPTLQPKLTLNLSAQYETLPLFDETKMSFRVDASYRSTTPDTGFMVTNVLPQYQSIVNTPPTWLLNARIALDQVKLPVGSMQIAVWAKNLTNNRAISFPENFGFLGSTEFQAARTFGLDVKFNY